MSEASLVKAQLVLPVADMSVAREWYALALGFETMYLHHDPAEDPAGNYAILRRDGAEVHLLLDEHQTSHPWTTPGTGYLFLIVKGVDAVYAQVQANGVAVTTAIARQDWGARAFQLTDPSGNLILVAEDLSG
ncbi:MAG: VOC family protein [Armatimonadetes bacterium]|nr:VOC family protein [Armatimonadota bacterium]